MSVPDAQAYYVVFQPETDISYADGMDRHIKLGTSLYGRSNMSSTRTFPGLNDYRPLFVGTPSLAVNVNLPQSAYASTYSFCVFPIRLGDSTSDTAFINNYAGGSGGAIYFRSDSSQIIFAPNTVFDGNAAKVDGGALYFDSFTTGIYLINVSFVGNNVFGTGGAVHIAYYVHTLMFINSAFSSNYAINGGVLFAGGANGDGEQSDRSTKPVLFEECEFLHNHANESQFSFVSALGGCLYLRASNSVKLVRCNFEDNWSDLEGGVVYMQSENYLHADECTFRGNYAKQDGGAVLLGVSNYAVLNKSAFLDNRAHRYGGAVEMYKSNSLNAFKCTFSGNSAGDSAGALYAVENNAIQVGSSNFLKNSALNDGGAVAVGTGCEMDLSSSTFKENSCLSKLCFGGVIWSIGASIKFLNGCNFMDNNASSGGALAVSTSDLTFLGGRTKFENNTAISGSAVYFHWSSLKLERVLLDFTNNTCLKNGGIFYAVCRNESCFQNISSVSETSNWNYAGYCDNSVATQPTELLLSHNIATSGYELPLQPFPSFTLLDYFENQKYTDSSTCISVRIISSNCFGRISYFSGKTEECVTYGNATFDHLQAFCYPGGSFVAEFIAVPNGFSATYQLSTTLNISFRECTTSEYLSNNLCLECPPNSNNANMASTCTCDDNYEGSGTGTSLVCTLKFLVRV